MPSGRLQRRRAQKTHHQVMDGSWTPCSYPRHARTHVHALSLRSSKKNCTQSKNCTHRIASKQSAIEEPQEALQEPQLKKQSNLAPQEPQSRNRKSRKDLQTAQGRPSKKRRDGHRRIARTDSEEPQGQRTTTITMTHHDHHTHPQPNSMRSGASAQLSVHPQLPNSR